MTFVMFEQELQSFSMHKYIHICNMRHTGQVQCVPEDEHNNMQASQALKLLPGSVRTKGHQKAGLKWGGIFYLLLFFFIVLLQAMN